MSSKRIFIISTAAVYSLLFLWLLHRHFAPFGAWSTSRLVSAPFPPERVEKIADGYRVKETPVYFAVDNPRKFDRAELTVRFRGEAPILYGGVVKNQDPWRGDQRVLFPKYLEELFFAPI